mmetsp:Transcript_11840/g.22823  ORF Transcript_11840/g.22823 Transcript_11840/m.22823 type:complete len:319 (-) Transcript_11840:775-1731(-)
MYSTDYNGSAFKDTTLCGGTAKFFLIRSSPVNPKHSPDFVKGINSAFDHGLIVKWTRGKPITLSANRDSRIVDRLHINTKFLHEDVRTLLAKLGIFDHYRDDVTIRINERNATFLQLLFHERCTFFLDITLPVAVTEILNACQCACRHRGRNGCRENETRGKTTNSIDDSCRSCNVTSVDTVGFTQGTGDHSYTIRQPPQLGNSATFLAIQAHGMHLINVSQCTVFIGQVANLLNRGNVPVHGIHALEHNELVSFGITFLKKLLQVFDVVVSPNVLWDSSIPDTLDHRCVVRSIREYLAFRQCFRNCTDCGFVSNKAR